MFYIQTPKLVGFGDNPPNNLTGKMMPTLEYLRMGAEFSILYNLGCFKATGWLNESKMAIRRMDET